MPKPSARAGLPLMVRRNRLAIAHAATRNRGFAFKRLDMAHGFFKQIDPKYCGVIGFQLCAHRREASRS
jgi:hypothetical protein